MKKDRSKNPGFEYDKDSCLLHNGKTSSEIKKIGKKQRLKSAECNSAKEVQIHIPPEIACAMGFTDSEEKDSVDFKTMPECPPKYFVPLFQCLLDLGLNLDDAKK